MKYMLLIHQGDTPLPGSDAWERLSEAERGEVFAAYTALNATRGVTPGERMARRRRPRPRSGGRTAGR